MLNVFGLGGSLVRVVVDQADLARQSLKITENQTVDRALRFALHGYTNSEQDRDGAGHSELSYANDRDFDAMRIDVARAQLGRYQGVLRGGRDREDFVVLQRTDSVSRGGLAEAAMVLRLSYSRHVLLGTGRTSSQPRMRDPRGVPSPSTFSTALLGRSRAHPHSSAFHRDVKLPVRVARRLPASRNERSDSRGLARNFPFLFCSRSLVLRTSTLYSSLPRLVRETKSTKSRVPSSAISSYNRPAEIVSK